MKNTDIENWRADWIWYPCAGRSVNFYFFARRAFNMDGQISNAAIRISAYTDYILFINGQYVGRGPNPSIPKYQYYDIYDIKKYLQEGKNVIAVIAHNYAIGMHWHPMGPGGLIAQAEVQTDHGQVMIASDETWKVKVAECYAASSPRMMWSCQFLETFDFKRYKEDWANTDFKDELWVHAEVIGKHPQYPWEHLIPREIPSLKEEMCFPTQIEKGEYELKGFHAVSFEGMIPVGENRIGYAQTYFHSDIEQKLILFISCDDAYKAFLNGKKVLEQGYDEGFVRGIVWNGREDYDQFHYSLGVRHISCEVILKQGWNRLLVAVDQGPGGWGFSTGFIKEKNLSDPNGISFSPKEYADLVFSSTCDISRNNWLLSGPFESTGLKNSMDAVQTDHVPRSELQMEYDPFDYSKITDYSLLMRGEKRKILCSTPACDPVALNKGEFCIIHMEQVCFGYPVFEIECDENSYVDIGYCNVLSEENNIHTMFQVRYVDRCYLGKGLQKWQGYSRREGRYILVSCRNGKNVRINRAGMNTTWYPVSDQSEFQCTNPLLDKIWKVSMYTSRILMQDGYQDCLKREGGVHNTRSFIHASMAALYAFGDFQLIKKAVLEGIRTQEDTGWFYSHGATDNNNDEITQCLWWFDLLKNYCFYTGDTQLVKDNYERIKGVLRYFSRFENTHMLIDGRNENRDLRGRVVYIDDAASKYPYRGLFDGMLFGYNVLYFGALVSMAAISAILGYVEDAGYYRKKAGYVRKSCNELFWNEYTGLYSDWIKDGVQSEESSQPMLIAALYFNICDEDKKKKLMNYICNTLGGATGNFENYNLTFGFYYFFLEVLFENGMEEMAFQLIEKCYGGWLGLGTTTFGEFLSLKDYKGKSKLEGEYNTHNYGTSAHPHFYSNILGIRPLGLGFEKILFAPHPGKLKWLQGKVWTPQGEVRLHMEIVGSRIDFEIMMPEQCRYEIKLPERFEMGKVTLNLV